MSSRPASPPDLNPLVSGTSIMIIDDVGEGKGIAGQRLGSESKDKRIGLRYLLSAFCGFILSTRTHARTKIRFKKSNTKVN